MSNTMCAVHETVWAPNSLTCTISLSEARSFRMELHRNLFAVFSDLFDTLSPPAKGPQVAMRQTLLPKGDLNEGRACPKEASNASVEKWDVGRKEKRAKNNLRCFEMFQLNFPEHLILRQGAIWTNGLISQLDSFKSHAENLKSDKVKDKVQM